jgi:hypothetical protein
VGGVNLRVLCVTLVFKSICNTACQMCADVRSAKGIRTDKALQTEDVGYEDYFVPFVI